jgi:hypothetical protein
MRRLIIYLAWAWEIIIGALLITPGNIVCIACGQAVDTTGYIGRPATMFVGVVAIVLGLYGLVTSIAPAAVAAER